MTSGGTFIKDFAFAGCGPIHRIHHVSITLETGSRRNDNICGARKICQRRIEFRRPSLRIGYLSEQNQ